MENTGHQFTTIYGRNLVGELPNFVHWPYLVVTMEDLWPKFEHYFDNNLAGVYFVNTLELDELGQELERLPNCNCVIGLGGGQALDSEGENAEEDQALPGLGRLHGTLPSQGLSKLRARAKEAPGRAWPGHPLVRLQRAGMAAWLVDRHEGW